MPNPVSTPALNSVTPMLTIAPTQVFRGSLSQAGSAITRLGQRPLVVGGQRTLGVVRPHLQSLLAANALDGAEADYGGECTEAGFLALRQAVLTHEADFVIGVGGGKALDAAKLLADRCRLPIVTLPTSPATCAAWTALSNVYSPQGAFLYDVSLAHCPALLILDYDLIATAPQRSLVAGIGDALAKWYEASVSSGDSDQALVIAAVQQARVLRDLLFQQAPMALADPGGAVWCQVVEATVLMAGVIGGLGGAQCRTVAAHAVHNGLTHLPACHQMLHGEKVAYGILVQLRLEEMLQGSQLALAARQQLLKFYRHLHLPLHLEDLGLGESTLQELQTVAAIACSPQSDIHRLPFAVTPEQLVAAMGSTLTVPGQESALNPVTVSGPPGSKVS
nr:iron-containing alcohol dehydrogenase family protein [Neosynechococcus sphagnicola]